MSRILRPDELSRIIGDFDRRLKALANHNPLNNAQALDGNGNPIWDSVGLIATMSLLGTGNQTGGAQNFSSTTLADVPGSSVTFTLTRPVNLEVVALVTGKVTAGTNNGLFAINVGALGATGTAYLGVTSYITLYAYFYVIAAPGGTYTAKLQAGVDVAATTLQLLGSTIQVFQRGR